VPSRPGDGSGEEEEEYGLSVLDLVKHAARTIIETLDARDRLGIVAFSTRTEVGGQPLSFTVLFTMRPVCLQSDAEKNQTITRT
jgi:hypothetical protein